MAARLTILGSGSSGNCAHLETADARLLIDAGLSARQIRQRLLGIGRTPENLSGILITHEHVDHVQGLAVLAARLGIPVYCNRLTREAIQLQFRDETFDFRIFSTGSSFVVGDMEVETFSVPHDASDPVGFLVRTPGGNVGFLTDLGHATRLAMDRVRPAQALVLEANHDVKMLQEDTRRSWSIKQRILSRHGHLSNEAAGALAREVASDTLRHVYLGHLSRDCNRPELALQVVGGALREAGATHVRLEAADQAVPCATLELTVAGPAQPALPVLEVSACGPAGQPQAG
ncbi:MAG: putative metallo-hydrolase YycJ [Verrucomicrobiota bacterium]